MSDDRTLITRFLEGDQRAFDQLVHKYQERIRRFMYQATENFDDGNDLAQDVFIKVYHNLHRFRGDSQLATWLYRIAANVLNSHFRRQRLREWLPLGETPALERDPGDDATGQRQELLAAIPRLSAQERKVVIFRGLQELSVKETALILGTSENVVKVAYHAARQKLKRIMSDA